MRMTFRYRWIQILLCSCLFHFTSATDGLVNVATPLHGGQCSTSLFLSCSALIDSNDRGIRDIWRYTFQDGFIPLGEWILFTFNDSYVLHNIEFHFGPSALASKHLPVSVLGIMVDTGSITSVSLPLYFNGAPVIKADLVNVTGKSVKVTFEELRTKENTNMECSEIKIYAYKELPSNPMITDTPLSHDCYTMNTQTANDVTTSRPENNTVSMTPYIVAIAVLCVLYVCTVITGIIYIVKLKRRYVKNVTVGNSGTNNINSGELSNAVAIKGDLNFAALQQSSNKSNSRSDHRSANHYSDMSNSRSDHRSADSDMSTVAGSGHGNSGNEESHILANEIKPLQ